MREMRAEVLDRLASFRLSDGILEVTLMKFTQVETGDWWVRRVVDYIPDRMWHHTNRMFLAPPRGWKPGRTEKGMSELFGQK